MFTAALLFIYILRVYILEGFYVVTYGLAIYTLNLLIGFLSPLNDPDESEDGTELPINAITPSDGEWKPFIRKVPEFKFWYGRENAHFPILNVDSVIGLRSLLPFLLPQKSNSNPSGNFYHRHFFTRYLCVSFFLTFIPFLNIPVVWQVLFIYFILLMIGQLKGRIQHMIKHKYWPGSVGKPTY